MDRGAWWFIVRLLHRVGQDWAVNIHTRTAQNHLQAKERVEMRKETAGRLDPEGPKEGCGSQTQQSFAQFHSQFSLREDEDLSPTDRWRVGL